MTTQEGASVPCCDTEETNSARPSLLTKRVLHDCVQEVRDRAEGLYERNRDKVQVWENDFEEKVRGHPLRSVAIAAGAGAALGLLLGVFALRR